MAHHVVDHHLGYFTPQATKANYVANAPGGVQAGGWALLQVDVDEEVRGEQGLHALGPFATHQAFYLDHGIVTVYLLILQVQTGPLFFLGAAIG